MFISAEDVPVYNLTRQITNEQEARLARDGINIHPTFCSYLLYKTALNSQIFQTFLNTIWVDDSTFRWTKLKFTIKDFYSNLNKSAVSCRFAHIYYRNLEWECSFFVQCSFEFFRSVFLKYYRTLFGQNLTFLKKNDMNSSI